MIKEPLENLPNRNEKGEKELSEEEKEKTNESESSSEYDDDEDDEEEDYDFAFEEDDEMQESRFPLVRAETKEIIVDYSYKKLTPEELLKILLEKINELKDIYSYANIDSTIYFTTLRKNLYIVREASTSLEDQVLKLMETRAIKEPDFSEGPLFCNLCFFEVNKKEEGADFGCGHTFCLECMKEYVKFKIA